MAEDYTVQEGESVASIARMRGFTWQTLWNDGGNAKLKDLRKDSDILMPGDILHVPDLQKKQESKPADQHHKFKVKNRQAKFKVTLLRQPKDTSHAQSLQDASSQHWKYVEPDRQEVKPEGMANVPYELFADGALIAKGNTDGDGKLSATVSPIAQAGLLVLNRGKAEERTLELHFREMDPITEPAGAARRLYNLGFPCATSATEVTPDIQEAVRRFRSREGLPAGNTLDDTTRSKLKDVYGG